MESKFKKRPLRHQSFILTLWAEASPSLHGPAVWRISVENLQTAERRGFRSVAELATFLEQWTVDPPAEELPIDD